MRAIIWIFMAGIMVISCADDDGDPVIHPPEEVPVMCEQSGCWDESFYVCRDTTYIELFTRTKGWTGGDATYSVDLKNGKTLWMFGDTFIDQVSEDRSRPSFRLINNSLVLQDGNVLTTYHGGTTANPQAFARPPESGEWYWPGDGTVVDGSLYLFMHGFGSGGNGAWDFFRTSIDLLRMNAETLEILDVKPIFDDPVISWGAAIFEDHDFTYVYGVRSDSSGKRLYVARTSADLSASWEYFTGVAWSGNVQDANSILEGVSEQFSVFERGGSYYLLSQNNLFGKEIYLYSATAPQGSFSNRRIIYCTPETGGNIFTYNAFAHPHVYADSLLVSYNVNSFDANDLLESADNYRPYFVKVKM